MNSSLNKNDNREWQSYEICTSLIYIYFYFLYNFYYWVLSLSSRISSKNGNYLPFDFINWSRWRKVNSFNNLIFIHIHPDLEKDCKSIFCIFKICRLSMLEILKLKNLDFTRTVSKVLNMKNIHWNYCKLTYELFWLKNT